MKTHFAPAQRADADQLDLDVRIVSTHPLIDGLMNMASGLLAVLNEQRQLLAVNDSFLNLLGIADPAQVIGLRPGESFHCIHAHEMPGGCGTSELCASCGAAVAMVACMEGNMPVEKKCAVSAMRNGKLADLIFKVRAVPVIFDRRRYLLLFLNDISKEQQWGNLERMFYHDVNNIICAISSRSELMLLDPNADVEKMAREINALSMRLSGEVSIQRQMFQTGLSTYQPLYRDVSVHRLLADIRNVFLNHPAAAGRFLNIREPADACVIETDYSLTVRILTNMVANALEATAAGGYVEFYTGMENGSICFCVRNEGVMPPHIAGRVFQRNFSTKEGAGRGLGTYAMKYFGETVLNGQVDFISSAQEGTIFRFRFPLKENNA